MASFAYEAMLLTCSLAYSVVAWLRKPCLAGPRRASFGFQRVMAVNQYQPRPYPLTVARTSWLNAEDLLDVDSAYTAYEAMLHLTLLRTPQIRCVSPHSGKAVTDFQEGKTE